MVRSYCSHLWVKKLRFGLGFHLLQASKGMGPVSLSFFFSAWESLEKTGRWRHLPNVIEGVALGSSGV